MPVSLSAEETLAEASLLEQSGDTQGAARLYAAWLKNNPDSPTYPEIYTRYFPLERDLSSLLDAGRRLKRTQDGLPGASGALLLAARVFELSGFLEEGRDAYTASFRNGASVGALISSLLLSIEMNDFESFDRDAALLRARGGEAADLLEAVAASARGDPSEGPASLETFVAGTGSDADLKGLWAIYEAAARQGDKKKSDEAASRIAERFPGSPEKVIVSPGNAGRVMLAPSPDLFIMGLHPEGAVPSVATQDAAAVPGRSAVQAGSYLVKENADDLVKVLARQGFSPVVREEIVSGKRLFRVYAGEPLETEQARALLEKLRQAGFAGLLVPAK